MDDPFDSARLHLEEAQENIRAFDELAASFIHRDNWTGIVDFDAKSGQHRAKVRFKTRLPRRLPMLAKRVFGDLRDSLDHALYASAKLTGTKPDPKRCKYPFGPTPVAVEAEIMEGRCDDLHPDVLKIVITSAPYETGNRTLWAMNKVRNRDTHSILSPATVEGSGYRINSMRGDHSGLVVDPDWRSTRNELTFASFTLGPNAQVNVTPMLQVTLGPAFGFGSEPATAVFKTTLDVVSGLVDQIETASRANIKGN